MRRLSALSLSGVTLTPVPSRRGRRRTQASVGHAVAETTVTATLTDAVEAGFEVKFNGVVDQDGVVPLAVGDGQCHFGRSDGAGWGDDDNIRGDCHESQGLADASLSALSLSGVTLIACLRIGDEWRTRRQWGTRWRRRQ